MDTKVVAIVVEEYIQLNTQVLTTFNLLSKSASQHVPWIVESSASFPAAKTLKSLLGFSDFLVGFPCPSRMKRYVFFTDFHITYTY